MANSFPRTLRSLHSAEARRSPLPLAALILVLGAWLTWAVLARVAVIEVSAKARLEVAHAIHPIEAVASGTVTETHLELDRHVAAGEVLVVLDSAIEALRLDEERARRAALDEQRERLRAELVAGTGVARSDERVTLAAIEGIRARQQGAAAEAGFSRVEADSAARLAQVQAAAGLDVMRLEAERRLRESTVASLAAELERLERERRTRSGEARVREVKLLREAAALDGEIATADSAIRRLEQEIERRRLRAPVAGRLGQIRPVRRGTRLRDGERVAVVVPDGGGLRAIAEFPVADAAGHIRAGQPARVRLDGFPSTAWGSLLARVVSVGSEPREGLLRVELAVTPDPSSRIPLQHGLPGQVEVEVERVAPMGLLARLAGRAVMEPQPEERRFPVTGGPEVAAGDER